MALAGLYGAFPALTLTLGPLPGGSSTVTIPTAGCEFSSAVNGGYDDLRCTISQDDALANSSFVKAWIPATISISASETAAMGPGTVVWDGYLLEPSQQPGNLVELTGTGAKAIAEDYDRQLTWAIDASDGWGPRDGDPYNAYPNSEDFALDATGDALTWRIGREIYSLDESAGAKHWIPGMLVRAVRYDMWRSGGGWDGGGFANQVYKFSGPTGQGTQVTSRAWNVAAPYANVGYTFRDVIGNPYDGIEFTCRCTNAINRTGTTYKIVRVRVNRIRLYDRAYVDGSSADDTWVAGGTGIRSVTKDICGLVKYVTSLGINSDTTQSVLPLSWDRGQSLADLLDFLATAEGRWWGVYGRTSGNFKLYFSPWGSVGSTNWFGSMSSGQISGRPTASNDMYNRAAVYYTLLNGHVKRAMLEADGLSGRPTDPFAGTFRANPPKNSDGSLGSPDSTHQPRVYPYELQDPQPDSALATRIAGAILSDYAVLRFRGSFTVQTANQDTSGGTELPAVNIKAGDTLTATDWPTGSKKFRVYGTRTIKGRTTAETTIDVGRDPSHLPKLLAKLQH